MGKLWAPVGQLARARIIDLVNGSVVTCAGFLMPDRSNIIDMFFICAPLMLRWKFFFNTWRTEDSNDELFH